MGRKKKASTQPQEEQLFPTEEQTTTTPEVGQSSENSPEEEQGTLTERQQKLKEAVEAVIDEFGGRDQIERKLELSRVLFTTYRENRGKTLEEITDSVLQEYRDKVGKSGYLGIDKDMIPIVEAFGTIKDKAALCVNALYDYGRDNKGEEFIITRKRVDRIREEIRTRGRKSMVEFVNYLTLYDSINHTKDLYFRTRYSYESCGLTAVAYFQTYEWLSKAEELFNSFASLVDPNKREEFNKLAQNYNNYLQSYQNYGGLDVVSGEGWIDTQRANCLDYADVATEFSTARLKEYKGMVEALNVWIKKNGAEMFVPMEIRNQLTRAEELSILPELQNKYYSSHIKSMEEQGETITDEDRKVAIFPKWEEIEPDEAMLKYFTSKLDDFHEKAKCE